MIPNRRRDFRLDCSALLLLLPLLAVSFVTAEPLFQSLTQQVAIAVCATMGIYVMLRLGLLSFAVPAFMAIGGYAAAMLAKTGSANLLLLMAASAVVPALVAVPIGLLVLRLKGIYFVFVTFIFNEILQLLIFEAPGLTGGSNGIAGIPAATIWGLDLESASAVTAVTVAICMVATVLSLVVTQRFRAEFSAIEENETLAESLGVALWKYRTIGFITSAAVAGLAGLALVNMLSTAHPSSFSTWSVNSYIAYVFIGGRGTMLGVLVGSVLLIVLTTAFSGYAQYSAGMFGVLLIFVMMVAPSGIVGAFIRLWDRDGSPRARTAGQRMGEA